jgi:uncharacterized protein (TIGR00297 family)
MQLSFLSGIVFILLMAAASVWRQKLTLAGGLAGALVAGFIFWGGGWAGLILLGTFFGGGIAATGWKQRFKQEAGLTGGPSGARTAGQVLANGGVAVSLAVLAGLDAARSGFWQMLMAAALSAALADTLSSELGNVYGRRFIDITTGRPGRRGEDGVISAEGTLAGLCGSLLIAALYCGFHGWSVSFWLIVAGGTAGNAADSFLGALLERKGYLNNDAVNVLNTAIGAGFAGGLAYFLQ